MANQANPGEQPGTQAGQHSAQNMGDDKQAKPLEPKHLADDATGRQEPSAHPKREPQHEPGFEAKQKAEADKAKPKGEENDHDKPKGEFNKPRAHTARAKQHVKRTPRRRHK